MNAKNKRNAISRSRNTPNQSKSNTAIYTPDDNSAVSIKPDPPPFSPRPPDPELEFEPDDMHDSAGDFRHHQDYGILDAVYGSGFDPLCEGYPDSQDGLRPPSPVESSKDDNIRNVEVPVQHSRGHTRSPVLVREPTTMETFSRTIRTFIPASIPITTATPSPPRVSRPVSFGSFLTPSTRMSPYVPDNAVSVTDTWKRRGSDSASERPGHNAILGGHRTASEEAAIFDLDEEVAHHTEDATPVSARYPSSNEKQEVIWAGWGSLVEGDPLTPRRLLLLGYQTGLQIWDCSNLASVSEILNLSGSPWGSVESIVVLPAPDSKDDLFKDKRPLIGVLSRSADWPDFIVYSLRTHEIIKTLSFPGLRSFSAESNVIVLGTCQPPYLYILSACTFSIVHTIRSALLIPFAPPQHSFIERNINLSRADLDAEHGVHSEEHSHNNVTQPIFALSGHLLAYASPIEQHDVPLPNTGVDFQISSPSVASDVTSKLGLAQADIGNVAVKLGGSVLSGMRSLGGMAYTAARSSVTAAVTSDNLTSTRAASGLNGLTGMLFSRSAPAESEGDRERQGSLPTGDNSTSAYRATHSQGESGARDGSTSAGRAASSHGGNVSIIDLRPLKSGSEPQKILSFTASKHQRVSNIAFSGDGTSVAIGFVDGHSVKVFRLRPMPRHIHSPVGASRSPEHTSAESLRSAAPSHSRYSNASTNDLQTITDPPWHMYDLRRGRTTAVIENVDWANDGRWFAMGTRRRTVHVFALNPYGGRPNESSHMLGRVVNASVLPSLSTEVSPLIRLRTDKTPPANRICSPLAITFAHFPEASLPTSLLPPATQSFSVSSSPSSLHSVSQVSPALAPRRPKNYQDLLIFDPYDATLSLRRLYVDRSAAEYSRGTSSLPLVGSSSISLPGMSTLGRLNPSPTSLQSSPQRSSELSHVLDKSPDLVARESRVGSWNLRRGQDWPNVRQSILPRQRASWPRPVKADWLSCAELSTHSTSLRVLPRSIYLSHQFSFHSFGEDYHALIRSHHLDFPVIKFEVRQEVEVSAYSTGLGETFIQGLSNPHNIGRPSTSFDEPLASALSAEIQYTNPSPPVLPMFPNGAGSTSRSLKNAIPIRNVAAGLTDSMSGSFGRLRREIGKARSPKLAALPDDGLSFSVPLEFDEADEDFMGGNVDTGVRIDDMMSRSVSRGEGDSGESISTPSSTVDPLPVEDDTGDAWQGWDREDQEAIDDAERFDDITVGFMDEEQATVRRVEKRRSKKGRIIHRT